MANPLYMQLSPWQESQEYERQMWLKDYRRLQEPKIEWPDHHRLEQLSIAQKPASKPRDKRLLLCK